MKRISVKSFAFSLIALMMGVPCDALAQEAADVYELPVVYPMQQDAVGEAMMSIVDGAEPEYTLYNNVLSATFVKSAKGLIFGGCEAMNLVGGTEPFRVVFGDGSKVVAASEMTLRSVEASHLEAEPNAVNGAKHFAGQQIEAKYAYSYAGKGLEITWRAVLRDGSHYLRTEMELTGVDDVDMHHVVPMLYNVDTKEAGSVPAVVGNTRGAVIMSDRIFAGLETPMAYNTVGDASMRQLVTSAGGTGAGESNGGYGLWLSKYLQVWQVQCFAGEKPKGRSHYCLQERQPPPQFRWCGFA